MLTYYPTEKEKEIISIMRSEKSEWETGQVWVSDRVKYQMLGRDGIIQKARKNYLGKFDVEFDEVTGKKKYFPPLTEDMVETIVKNIDLDSVDIQIRATNPNGFSSALILRYLIGYFMRKNYFGEVLNELLRQFCIDGTIVLKTIKNYDSFLKKQVIKTPIPDITNFLIDPSENNIQEAGAVIERNVLKLSEAKKYPWDNLEYLTGSTSIERLYGLQRVTSTEVPYIEIFERHGDLPIGKNGEWIPAIAIVSNLDTNPVPHKITPNSSGIKPYEECRFRKIFGRWHGRGVGEVLLSTQSYLAETVNLRMNQARIAQLGLWKVRKGSGISQQLLSSLVSGGAIPVTRMDDINELRTSDIKPSSYKDAQDAYTWAQRTTGAWEVSRGEMLPASLPATTAVLQERATRSGYNLLQENLGIFLSKVFERHIIPLILETIKDKEVISIIGSPEELKEIDENFINQEMNRHILNSMTKTDEKGNFIGEIPKPAFIEHLRGMYRDNLKQFQKTRYFSINKRMLTNWQYEVEVFVTGEAFNKAVMVKQLTDLVMVYSRIPGINIDTTAVIKEIFDLMGLGGSRFLRSKEEETMRPPRLEVPRPAMPRPETEMVGEAATLERMGRGGIR